MTVESGGENVVGDAWAYQRSDHLSAVVYRGIDKHIHELTKAWAPQVTAWQDNDLTFLSNAPSVDEGSNPMAYIKSGDSNAVIYRRGGHLQEISLKGSAWIFRDLTLDSGTSAVAVGNPMGYARSDNLNTIVYRTADNHIHELGVIGDAIGENDFFVTSGESVPAAGDPSGYARSAQQNAVDYVGVDGKIHEVLLTIGGPGSGWTHSILPSIAPTGTPFGYLRGDGKPAIVYRSGPVGAYSIREIVLSGEWTDSSLAANPQGASLSVGPFAYRALNGVDAVLALDALGALVQYRRSSGALWKVSTY